MLLRVQVGQIRRRNKIVLIAWNGPRTPSLDRMFMLYKPQISTLFEPIHIEVTASRLQDVSMSTIQHELRHYVDSDQIMLRVVPVKSDLGSIDGLLMETPVLIDVDVGTTVGKISRV